MPPDREAAIRMWQAGCEGGIAGACAAVGTHGIDETDAVETETGSEPDEDEE